MSGTERILVFLTLLCGKEKQSELNMTKLKMHPESLFITCYLLHDCNMYDWYMKGDNVLFKTTGDLLAYPVHEQN